MDSKQNKTGTENTELSNKKGHLEHREHATDVNQTQPQHEQPADPQHFEPQADQQQREPRADLH